MNRVKKSMFACMLAIVLTTVLTTEVASAAGPTGAMWSVVASPSVGTGFNVLLSVAAVSATDLWTVGVSQNSTNGANQTLIEHWDGTSWQVVKSPKPGFSSILYGVTAVSASNLWAVGYSQNSSNIDQTLIEHWNGTSWQVVKSPNVAGSDFNPLYGVVAVSADDIWAVGSAVGTSNAEQTLIEHWNGASWKIIPSPKPGLSSYLQGVASISASNIWAVGTFVSSSSVSQTLVEHWNGMSWQVVSSPNPEPSGNGLNGVAAVSASNIWAVGDSQSSSGFYQTLIEHWNGTNWQVVASPNVGSNNNALVSVAAISASNSWAVGYHTHKTLIEHWN